MKERITIHTVKDKEVKKILSKEVTVFDIQSIKMKQYGFQILFKNKLLLTCLGDEPFNEKNGKYAINSDYLLHEAFCLYSMSDRYHPYKIQHSPSKDAGMVAEKLNVKNLVLYHTEEETKDRKRELYTEEAKAHYQGNVIVPYDLDRILLIK